ncbi:MFS transporter [Orrella marina]|nr:MFS transporter [Orrella marina]
MTTDKMNAANVRQERPSHPQWVESIYERLAEDDEGRVCKAISDNACRESPGNFVRMLIANTLSNLADRLASAKTTLPWLLMQLGAPAWMLSLLVPIRESGSMLPQLWIGASIRQRAVRKWIWVAGGISQGLCLLVMGWVAMALEGWGAGALIVALLVVFSVSRGACSVAFKDVQGKTIPKTRRGRLSGWISMISGLAALGVGVLVGGLQSDSSQEVFVMLLAAAALLWLLAAIVFSRMIEEPGATEGGADGWRAALDKLSLLRTDLPFRRFVFARALALGTGLAAPFYVVLARDSLGDAISLLGLFIAVEGLASLVSSPVWGKWADRSSKQVFATACAMASILSLMVTIWSWVPASDLAHQAFYLLAFFGLGIAHAGVRLGRKTYLVDMAQGNKRTDYVAVSNTVIGALLLVVGLVAGLVASVSTQAALILLALAGLSGAWMSLRWKDVSG